MPGTSYPSRVGRRGFMRTAAVAAGAAAVPVAAERTTAQSGELAPPAKSAAVMVAATVVRTDFAPGSSNRLNVGVRASLRAPGAEADGIVLVVEGLDAAAPVADLNRFVAAGVRAQAARFLGERGVAADPEAIAVRLFGGAL